MSHIPGQADQRSAADVYSARCPSRAALALIADKWAVLVAGCLVDGPKRHSWLRHQIGGISGKMLTRTLREPVAALTDWATANGRQVVEARRRNGLPVERSS